MVEMLDNERFANGSGYLLVDRQSWEGTKRKRKSNVVFLVGTLRRGNI
jgi:hypothetical protein